MDSILTTLVAAVALGIASQVIAERFQLPAILPLLVLGIFCGPFGIGFVQPETLGEAFAALIHLGVAIILFEGGLSLDPSRILKVGAAVRNLLTIGVAITGVASAATAHWVIGMSWTTAALFGAIVTVTGPTVIVPLLRHMIAPREIKTILLSEGLIVDPIGAILAYLVLQWIERAGIPPLALATELLALIATGVVLGFVSGALARFILRTRLVGGELRNLSILALLMVCYLAAEHQAPQSGILATMVMGFTISAAELPDLVSVRTFKGQLTTLIISVLFILLAAQLDLGAVLALGWDGVIAVAALILLVRPLAVAASVPATGLAWRGSTLIALTAPRGIVAAAVASLAARQMKASGLAGATELEGLVYLTILATGVWSTLGAIALPRLLGFTADPARRRAILVGANPLTEIVARRLAAAGRTTLVIDSLSWRLDSFRAAGLQAVVGDARDAATYEEAGVEQDSLVLAATTNDELNLLVAELVHAEFGVEHPVVAIQQPPEELGRRSRGWIDVLGGSSVDVPEWIRAVETGGCAELVVNPRSDAAVAALHVAEREHPHGVLRLLGTLRGQPELDVSDERLPQLDRLILLVRNGSPLELLSPQRLAEETRSRIAAGHPGPAREDLPSAGAGTASPTEPG